MGQGAAGALALVLIWVAFIAFFVAFHPGGLTLANGQSAQNPRDVILWLMQRVAGGSPVTSAGGGTGNAPTQAE